MTRPRDFAYEALAEVTGAHQNTSRGELNSSLKAIRIMHPEVESSILAKEIKHRASRYRQMFGDDVALTPTALSKHWVRVVQEQPKIKSTNQSVTSSDDCTMCGGDRFVLVATRKPRTSSWMEQRGIEADPETLLEEFAPCPTCNPVMVTMRTADGRRISTPDPGRTREMMRQ